MTDKENFIEMINKAKVKYSLEQLFDTKFISFEIGGGIGGSKTAFVCAFFDEKTGNLKGFHWDD